MCVYWGRGGEVNIANRFMLQKRDKLPAGGGGTPYNGLYGEAPSERGTFFRLQVYKRVGISQV